jgi:peptidoglycan/LPS O-acetylase OafA/YrhL
MKILGKHHFFPGLNGLRAIAALCVLINHTGTFLGIFGFPNAGRFNHFILSGYESVALFFVLSGFIITYRLLEEQKQTEKINLKNFYFGRLLRIAPLQILIVGISFLIFLFFYGLIPSYHEPIHPLITFPLLILIPNIPLLTDNPVLAGAHMWSLGVENEFYMIWPLLLMRFKNSILRMMVSIILIKFILVIIILPFFITHIYSNHFTNLLNEFLVILAIESMAVGGLGAWLVFNQKKIVMGVLFNPVSQFVLYMSIIWLIYRNSWEKPIYLEKFVVPFIFLSLILNVSCNPRSFFKYENLIFNYLGKISYGIYMFHPSIIFFTIWFTYQHVSPDNAWYFAFIYIISVILTIGVAALSYKYFEAPIMRLKRRKISIEAPLPATFSASNPIS